MKLLALLLLMLLLACTPDVLRARRLPRRSRREAGYACVATPHALADTAEPEPFAVPWWLAGPRAAYTLSRATP